MSGESTLVTSSSGIIPPFLSLNVWDEPANETTITYEENSSPINSNSTTNAGIINSGVNTIRIARATLNKLVEYITSDHPDGKFFIFIL